MKQRRLESSLGKFKKKSRKSLLVKSEAKFLELVEEGSHEKEFLHNKKKLVIPAELVQHKIPFDILSTTTDID